MGPKQCSWFANPLGRSLITSQAGRWAWIASLRGATAASRSQSSLFTPKPAQNSQTRGKGLHCQQVCPGKPILKEGHIHSLLWHRQLEVPKQSIRGAQIIYCGCAPPPSKAPPPDSAAIRPGPAQPGDSPGSRSKVGLRPPRSEQRPGSNLGCRAIQKPPLSDGPAARASHPVFPGTY